MDLGMPVGNSWRNTGDIAANWNSIMGILDQQVGLDGYSGPGGWNDPDMLEVGVGGVTGTEGRAHFSLWSLLNAPLIAGNDLRTMSADTRTILTNTEVIAVNQDWGGRQGHKISDNGNLEVWRKPMSNGSVAVVLLNRGTSTSTSPPPPPLWGWGPRPPTRCATCGRTRRPPRPGRSARRSPDTGRPCTS